MKYQPLNASRNEIRLLVLPQYPEPSNLSVYCKLEHFSLDETGPGCVDNKPSTRNPPSAIFINPNNPSFLWGDYVALSYVWGAQDPDGQGRIIVNDHMVKVTENLEAALRELQQSSKITTGGTDLKIWVDALCINQNDIEERSQ